MEGKINCSCTADQKFHFKHRCRELKRVSLAHINSWFFSDDSNYVLSREIAHLMCICLLDPTVDYHSCISDLEELHSFDLTGLSLIIEDYQKWYSSWFKSPLG